MARLYLLVAPLLLLSSMARADQAADATQCQQSAGSFLTGTVSNGPKFQSGKERRHGVWLSHTHVTLKADDGTSYDVAIDNVFAKGYRRNEADVPAPLDAIRTGDRLELCGQLYTGGDVGIHWVHTNCGDRPTSDKPDGWVRKLDADGNAGDNMESNQAFCGLWSN